MLAKLHRRINARPGIVVILAVGSAIPMTYWSSLVFSDVRADIQELLPKNARSVQTLRRLEERFGTSAELAIVVESDDPAANRRFSDDLVARLSASPLFRSVRNKMGAEQAFMHERRHLFVDTDDLVTIHERIRNAEIAAKKAANPLLVDLDDDPEPVHVDLSDIEAKYNDKLARVQQFKHDYFESEDARKLAILAHKKGTAFAISENQAAVDVVTQSIAALQPKTYAPSLTVRIGGDVKNLIEEQESLVSDLALATIVTSVLLALVVFLFYRTARSALLIGVPILIGVAWTFGLGHFLVGYLNASSAFLGPIVAGNGINFGLVLLARYLEDRRSGMATDAAIEHAVVMTGRGTSGAAAAAGIAYLSLLLTSNRGFIHFGLIAGVGMIVCWVATFTIMPALIRVIEHRWPLDIKSGARDLSRWGELPFALVRRAPALFAVMGVVTTVAGLWLGLRHFQDPFEKDYSKLRSTHARDHGATRVAKEVDEIFRRYSMPQVFLADDAAEADAIVTVLDEAIRRGGEHAPLTEAVALSSFVPPDQKRRLELLAAIRERLSDELLSQLDEPTRALAEKYRPPKDLEPFGLADLPEGIREKFREKSGEEGRVVLVFPNYKLNLYHADEVKRVANLMRSISLPNGKIVESSGNFVIYDDMLLSVMKDGPRATLLSLLGVVILCFLLFRGWRWVPVTGGLLCGVAWMTGLMYLFDFRINFLNFIALPITFGIGVDYSLNIYARYLIERLHHHPEEAAHHAVASTGGAVILCSLTTIIGYGSLLIAENGSLRAFGNLAILGEFTCLFAAVFVMPAWLFFRARKKPSMVQGLEVAAKTEP